LFNTSQEVNIDNTIYKSMPFANQANEDLVPPPLIKRLNMELENRNL